MCADAAVPPGDSGIDALPNGHAAAYAISLCSVMPNGHAGCDALTNGHAAGGCNGLPNGHAGGTSSIYLNGHVAGSPDSKCDAVVPNGHAGESPSAAPDLLTFSLLRRLLDVNGERRAFICSIRRLVKASSKGFAIGAGLKGGLALFSILARLRARRYLRSRKIGAMTNEEAVALALKETLRYGMFLGTFAGVFVSIDECLATIWGRKRTARWRSLLAGLMAGPSMLMTGPNTQHTSLAIYILMRAAVLTTRCGIRSKRYGSICKPLTWAHGDIFLMCLSSSQILSAYILSQESLPLSYKAFLNKHGGKDPIILQGVKEIATSTPFSNLEGIEMHYRGNGIDLKLDPHMKVPCSIVHGNLSCVAHFLSFLFQAYGRALPVYLPVYLVPALVVHRQGLFKRPYQILGKSLKGTARSSLFLSSYCASAWAWTCLLFRMFKRCNIPMVAMGTFPTGLALLIEKKSRRIEISLYCLARAIESFFTCLSNAGLCPPASKLKRADVIVFSMATSVIMHCYSQERDVFRSKYLNVLDWVFGVPPECNDEHVKTD